MKIAIRLFLFPLNHLSRISLLNHSTSQGVLTSRNRGPPTLSGNNSAPQLTVFSTDDVLQPLREHDPLRRRAHQRIRAEREATLLLSPEGTAAR